MTEAPRHWVEPAFGRTSFRCPHCGIHAQHVWSALFHADPGPRNGAAPEAFASLAEYVELTAAAHASILALSILRRMGEMIPGKIYALDTKEFVREKYHELITLLEERIIINWWLARCASCLRTNLGLWDGQEARMIWPRARSAPPPNADLPEAIQTDYEEAALIAEDSPRGAAALLRLCVEKLCLHVLGRERGNLNEMTGELVARGLDEEVQKMLDIVRVVANGAVHPGTIDLADDPETVRTLFALVNEIAEEVISKPKRIEVMYTCLPHKARAAIRSPGHGQGPSHGLRSVPHEQPERRLRIPGSYSDALRPWRHLAR